MKRYHYHANGSEIADSAFLNIAVNFHQHLSPNVSNPQHRIQTKFRQGTLI